MIRKEICRDSKKSRDKSKEKSKSSKSSSSKEKKKISSKDEAKKIKEVKPVPKQDEYAYEVGFRVIQVKYHFKKLTAPSFVYLPK